MTWPRSSSGTCPTRCAGLAVCLDFVLIQAADVVKRPKHTPASLTNDARAADACLAVWLAQWSGPLIFRTQAIRYAAELAVLFYLDTMLTTLVVSHPRSLSLESSGLRSSDCLALTIWIIFWIFGLPSR